MKHRIRQANVADIPALAELVVASYRSAFHDILGEAGLAARPRAYFEARFGAEIAHIRLAKDAAGAIAGMAEVREGTLDMMFVDPAATGRGHGSALLRDAEARGAVALECFAANAPALHFYARHGWQVATEYERPFMGRMHRFLALEKARGAL